MEEMSTEQKRMLLKIAREIIRNFNNDMVDHWTEKNFQISDECNRNLNVWTEEYRKLYGELPNWPYINDVVDTRDTINQELKE